MQRAEEKEYCRHSVSGVVSDSFKIRRATVSDADVIAWQRARMFQDMGDVSGDAFEILRTTARARLEQWIDSGDYIGWLSYNRSCHARSMHRQLAKADRAQL